VDRSCGWRLDDWPALRTTGDVDWIKVTLTAGTRTSSICKGVRLDKDFDIALSWSFGATGMHWFFCYSGGPSAARKYFTPQRHRDVFFSPQSHVLAATCTYRSAPTFSPRRWPTITRLRLRRRIDCGWRSTTGSIETTGDVDWIKVTLTAGPRTSSICKGVGWTRDFDIALSWSFGAPGMPLVLCLQRRAFPSSPQILYTAASTGTHSSPQSPLSLRRHRN